MCNSCSKPLTGSKYYEVIYRDARDHDKEKRIDDLSNDKEKKDEDESIKAEEHDKEKEERISNYKKALMALDDEELDLIIENMKSKLAKLRTELENPDEEEKEKQSKSAEFIGVHNYQSVSIDGDDAIDQLQTLQRHRYKHKKLKHSQSYSVLTLDQNHNESKRGDSLLQRMGSVD